LPGCHKPHLRCFHQTNRSTVADIHAQHARKSYWRAPGTDGLRVKRIDGLLKLFPRRSFVDLGKETIAPRQLFLGRVFEAGKTLLHDRLVIDERA
jgi:hypothetical protein